MQEQTVIVKWRAGVHARPAGELVKLANQFTCDITFRKNDVEVNAKSILGIMTLGATYKTPLDIVTDGEDEKKALQVIVEFFEKGE